MSGKKFEVGKNYRNGFSVCEYGVDLHYESEYLCVGRSAKFVSFLDKDYNREVRAKVRQDSEGNESIYCKKIYPYRLSALSEVVA